MDCVWFYRTQITHGSQPILDRFINSTLKFYQEHGHARTYNLSQIFPSWNPPSVGIVSIAFDVAIRKNGSTTAAVCRDHLGNIIGCVTEFSHISNPNGGKALAAFIGLNMAPGRQWKNVIIEGYSYVVISTLNNPQQILDWTIETKIRDSRTILNGFDKWEAIKIHRTQNRCTHTLAQ